MSPHAWRVIVLFLCFSIGASGGVSAQPEVLELQHQIASLTDLVQKLSARVEELETARDLEREIAAAPAPSLPKPASSQLTQASGRSNTSGGVYQNLNPDISVAGVATGKWTSDKRDPERNTFGLEESEIVFSKNISPYSRGNLTLGLDGEHADVEEGYVDIAHVLPGKVEARVGKFLVPAGFLNTIHAHDWPMVAKPRSLEFFTGKEGFSEKGLSLSSPIDLRSKTWLKANVDVLKGSNGVLFNADQTRVYGGRLSANTPLNDRDDLNFGANFHRGAWDAVGNLDSDLYGFDLMLRRRFNQFDRLVLWGEWLWNRRQQVARSDTTAGGYYLDLLYKFKKERNWHVGLEYDCSQKPGDTRFNTISTSAYLGYWLTENDRLQLQFRANRDPFLGVTNNEVLFEVIWGMGPHKPHLANF